MARERIAAAPRQDKRFCFTWFGGEPLPGARRGALIKASKWTSGDIITVSFLDGVPRVQDKVRAFTAEWTEPGLANLSLAFRADTTDTMIRISFRRPGSWSTIGNTCMDITDLRRPTMNFGWLDESTSDDEVRRVVLHEFGHALGMVHEHQNPAGGIKWNKRQVYSDLSGPPNNWSKAEIDENMFRPYRENETNYTAMDPQSIMMYPIPRRWTLDGFSVGLNSDLSETDKQFIAEQYP